MPGFLLAFACRRTIVVSLPVQDPWIQLLFLLLTCCSSALSCSSWAVRILLPSSSPGLILALLSYLSQHFKAAAAPATTSSLTFLPGCCVSIYLPCCCRGDHKFCFTTSFGGYNRLRGRRRRPGWVPGWQRVWGSSRFGLWWGRLFAVVVREAPGAKTRRFVGAPGAPPLCTVAGQQPWLSLLQEGAVSVHSLSCQRREPDFEHVCVYVLALDDTGCAHTGKCPLVNQVSGFARLLSWVWRWVSKARAWAVLQWLALLWGVLLGCPVRGVLSVTCCSWAICWPLPLLQSSLAGFALRFLLALCNLLLCLRAWCCASSSLQPDHKLHLDKDKLSILVRGGYTYGALLEVIFFFPFGQMLQLN